jgi:hypothetical protein
MATHALRDVDPTCITICKKGANRQRIFLKKEADAGDANVVLPAPHDLMKTGDDWSAFYCVVAEPGAEEDPGQGSDQSIIDVWADESEIRKAAHRFAKNKGYVNRMHGALAEQGCHVVENAIALQDIAVGDQTIKKGSWYLAIEPSQEMRALVESGEITGVSLEGSGVRELLGKAASFAGAARCKSCGSKVAMDAKSCQNCGGSSLAKVGTTHEPTTAPGGPGLFRMKGKQLPAVIQHVFNDLVQSGHPKGPLTYRLAIGIVRNWAQGHDGKGNKVSADVQRKAAAAIAEWEKLKAEAKAKPNIKKVDDMDDDDKRGLMHRIGVALGLAKGGEEVDGLTDEETALIEAALRDGTGTVVNKTPEEDDTVDKDTQDRIEKIEKSVEETNGAISTLSGLVEKLVDHATKQKEREDAASTDPAKLKKAIEAIAEDQQATTTALAKIAESVEQLAVGGSSQHDDADTLRKEKKDEPWYAGIFD